MAKFHCRLCGGKLVDNRCILCGLDNSCYDQEFSCHKIFSGHQPSPKKQSPPAKQPPPAKQSPPVKQSTPVKQAPSHSEYKKTVATAPKNRNRIVWITVIIVTVLILVSVISSAMPALTGTTGFLTSSSPFDDHAAPSEDLDPYAFVTRDIPEDGEVYETVLGTGVYQTGIHIPEGIYRAELLAGAGSIYISDAENSIYDSTYFGTDEEYDEVTAMDDIRLYNGAGLHVDSGMLIRLSTENAQPLTEVPYPAAETDSISLPEGEYTAGGEEIPEGIYDISIDTNEEEPYGYASIILLYPNGSSEYFWADSPETAVSADGYTSAGIKNAVIPDGTEISVEYGNIILTPGQTCYDADYANYPPQ